MMKKTMAGKKESAGSKGAKKGTAKGVKKGMKKGY